MTGLSISDLGLRIIERKNIYLGFVIRMGPVVTSYPATRNPQQKPAISNQ